MAVAVLSAGCDFAGIVPILVCMRIDADMAFAPPVEVCDFCTQAVLCKAYACHPFVYLKGTPMEHWSSGHWAACEACALLIDAGKWGALAERAARAFVREHRLPQSEVTLVRQQMNNLHTAFRQYMIPEA